MNFFSVYFRISNHKFLWMSSKGEIIEQGGHISLCESVKKFFEFIRPKLEMADYFCVYILVTEECALSKELTENLMHKLIPCEFHLRYTPNYIDEEYMFRVKTNSEQLMEKMS